MSSNRGELSLGAGFPDCEPVSTLVVVVVVLSRLVLDESLTSVKIVGLVLTVAGVALLSYVG